MINQDKIRLQELSHKSLMGTITDAEKKELNDWLNQVEEKPLEIPRERAEDKQQYGEYLFHQISERTGITPEKQSTTLWPRIAIAAAIVFIVMGVYFFRSSFTSRDPDATTQSAAEIVPGKNGATLTLANGQKISINEALAGNIATQSGVKITKDKNGQIIYELTDQGSDKVEYNTLTTTRGEQTQLRLPDGSLVFLNAASSLKYPTSFAKSKERRVSLTGEAYFEISHNKKAPFRVTASSQTIEVLGTHFNVMAYQEEKVIKTTLLEGSVSISDHGLTEILKPGQQAQVTAQRIEIKEAVDLEDVMAWKNGYFKFNESLESIMNKIGRWYDVQIVYDGKIDKTMEFGGEISRSKNISSALKIMELTGNVHFKIEGRRVIVTQ